MAVTWQLDRRPLAAVDRDALGSALERAGADASLLDVYETTVRAGRRWTRPVWLTARQDGRLLGATLLVLCRDYGASFVGPSPAAAVTRAGPAIWYWDRTSLGADGVSCPGLVVDGVGEEEFADRAVRRLARRLVGTLVDSRPPPVPHVARPFIGACRRDVDPAGDPTAPLLAEHRHLGRKLRRFAAHGGTVEEVRGRLPDDVRPALMAGYALDRPVNPPWVAMYPRLVAGHWDLDDPRLVHLLARLDGDLVGYQTFWHAGRHLVMLSGVVSRPAGGTWHAYENLVLASLDLAARLGCTLADFGMGVNAAKVSLLGCRPSTLHFVSRWAPVRAGLRVAVPRSRLSTESLEQARGRLSAPAGAAPASRGAGTGG